MNTQTLVAADDALRGHLGPLTLSDHLAHAAEEGRRFATAAAAGPLDVPIDACPGWTMRKLVQHVGLVHLWAAANIAYPSESWLTVNEMPDLAPYWPAHTAGWPEDRDLVAWYRSTLELLIEVIESMPEDHRCLTFLPAPSPLMMWARRQACEIAIHRHDAETARGLTTTFDPPFAADVLDELLHGFAPRMRVRGTNTDVVLQIVAEDVGDRHLVTMGSVGIRTERADGRHDLMISGSAADIAIFLWNRPAGPSLRIEGDDAALDVWRETCRIEWL
jgi:uncharacterized protein (TIGR03083 family)